MNVRQLIKFLQEQDPEAIIMAEENGNVTRRRNWHEADITVEKFNYYSEPPDYTGYEKVSDYNHREKEKSDSVTGILFTT